MLFRLKFTLSLLLITLLSTTSYSQVTFEPGYIVDNSGNKIECFIKNVGWKNNPTSFEYRTNVDSEIKNGYINNIAEFSLNNGKKYIRQEVKIDRSKTLLKRLSKSKEAVLNSEKLFLEEIVSGDANLFYYEDSNLIRFFFNTTNTSTEQLIYKKYLTADNKVGENTNYKKQLWDNLQCGNITLNDVKSIDYKKLN